MTATAFRYSKALEPHAICASCWQTRAARQRQPLREPVRVNGAGIDACCFCGDLSTAGIYVRESSDPTMLDAATHCRGHGR
jgi:hypothetical protein